jgi:hypothetical protein
MELAFELREELRDVQRILKQQRDRMERLKHQTEYDEDYVQWLSESQKDDE